MSEVREKSKESKKVQGKHPAVRPTDLGESVGLGDLIGQLRDFRDEREWGQFHGLKNLMLSVSVEAAELLEIAQWKTDAQMEEALADPAIRARLEEEVADVFLYLLLLCDRAGIDLPRAAAAKIRVNGEKYPVHKARGRAVKYDRLDK